MKILVIKLGALGDVVLAFQPFADIRAHHPAAHITLLTTQAFAPLLAGSPWFDHIEIDTRPAWWEFSAILRLRRTLHGFDRVYDLQTSSRSSRYYRLAGRPPWSGIARGAVFRHTNPARNQMHTIERQRDQLAAAGVAPSAPAKLDWLIGESPGWTQAAGQGGTMAVAALNHPFALMIPGAAPHRPGKRWPPVRFAALAKILEFGGIPTVIAGTGADTPLAAIIRQICPTAADLTGQTTLPELAALAARAQFAVGNDTGPMHLAAAVGTPSLVLFSHDSDPALTAPRGAVTVLRVPNLADLPTHRVAEALPLAHTTRPAD